MYVSLLTLPSLILALNTDLSHNTKTPVVEGISDVDTTLPKNVCHCCVFYLSAGCQIHLGYPSGNPSYVDHVYKLEFLDKPKRCAPSMEGGLAFSAHRCLAPTSIAQYFPYFSALYRPLVTAFSTTSSRSLSLY